MEKAIWKFGLEVVDLQDIEMPIGAEILSVQTQYNKVCIWAVCDPEAKKEKRVFMVKGTGHKFDDSDLEYATFIGTTQMHEGQLIWHVYEVMRK